MGGRHYSQQIRLGEFQDPGAFMGTNPRKNSVPAADSSTCKEPKPHRSCGVCAVARLRPVMSCFPLTACFSAKHILDKRS